MIVAVVGAGTIGLSWAALFASHGHDVRVTDPRADLATVVTAGMTELAGVLPGDWAKRVDVSGECYATAPCDLSVAKLLALTELQRDAMVEISASAGCCPPFCAVALVKCAQASIKNIATFQGLILLCFNYPY